VTKETTKYALRRALEQIVPPHVLNRRKLGFPVPTRHWLAEQLHDWARQIIDGEPDRRCGWTSSRSRDAAATARTIPAASAVDYSRKLWTPAWSS
jgi:asparagine synthase (glutamine-hydrolysing)